MRKLTPEEVAKMSVEDRCARILDEFDEWLAIRRLQLELKYEDLAHWDPVAKMEARWLQVVTVRVARDKVPPHVRIHSWKWDKRVASTGSVPR